jgi:hypothetical protein
MPYNSWLQFRRQRRSVGLPIDFATLLQAYPSRPLTHSQWNNRDTFGPNDVPSALPAWVQNNGGVVVIQTAGLATELLNAIEGYGAFLESIVPRKPVIIRGSAGGAIMHDRATDRLYYGASRFVSGLQKHAVLAAREMRLPLVHGKAGAIRTKVRMRHAQTCAEFQVLNEALFDGAKENDLDLWCFHVATMEPYPRCPNCRDTVPDIALRRIWTCWLRSIHERWFMKKPQKISVRPRDFSPKASAYLHTAGWTPSRTVDTTLYEEAFAREGLPLFPKAKSFLRRFGGLSIRYVTALQQPDVLEFQAARAVRGMGAGALEGFEELIGAGALCPIGHCFHGTCMLLMDNKGHVFGGSDETITFEGDRGEVAISNILSGVEGEILEPKSIS